MPTLQTAFLPEDGGVISPDRLGYLHARIAYGFYDYVLRKFLSAQHNGLTKAELARRIGKSPAVVNRLLASPGNWTLETLSSLLAGICAEEFVPYSKSLLNRQPRNFTEPDWISRRPDSGSAAAGEISVKEAA
jgi:Helix-turn-helix